jgi:hypothetical protein
MSGVDDFLNSENNMFLNAYYEELVTAISKQSIEK